MLIAHRRVFKFHMKHSGKTYCFKTSEGKLNYTHYFHRNIKFFCAYLNIRSIDAWKKLSFLIYPHSQHDSSNACFLTFHLRYYQHYTDFCCNSVKNVGKIARKFLIFEFKILSQTVWEAFLKTAIFDTFDMSA